MFLLSGSMHLGLEVLLAVGADEEVSLTETERIRLLADYIQETERFDLEFIYRKWCYTRLLHDFPLHPLISPFHFHFQTFVT
jgi:hypothetical protein